MTKPTKSDQRNMLSRKDSFQLMTWLTSQKERLERDRPRREAVAAEATAALGFPVSAPNVLGCLQDLGITWTVRRVVTKGSTGLRAQLAALAARVDTLEKDMAAERQLRKLAEQRLFALEETLTAPARLTVVR